MGERYSGLNLAACSTHGLLQHIITVFIICINAVCTSGDCRLVGRFAPRSSHSIKLRRTPIAAIQCTARRAPVKSTLPPARVLLARHHLLAIAQQHLRATVHPRIRYRVVSAMRRSVEPTAPFRSFDPGIHRGRLRGRLGAARTGLPEERAATRCIHQLGRSDEAHLHVLCRRSST